MNGKLTFERAETLPEGTQNYNFTLQAPATGVITLQARVMVNGDPNPEINSAFASAQVFPAPHTLFISDGLERVEVFGAALQSGGIQIDAVSPDQFPTDVQSLEQYQVIFLDNLLIQSLTQEQVAALKLFVSKFGKGLVFLGGQHTYTLGGFENSFA